MDHHRLVDLRGLCCSAPVIKLTAEIKGMRIGEVLLAEADKDSMRKDVPAYCNQTRHELLQHEEQDGLLRILDPQDTLEPRADPAGGDTACIKEAVFVVPCVTRLPANSAR